MRRGINKIVPPRIRDSLLVGAVVCAAAGAAAGQAIEVPLTFEKPQEATALQGHYRWPQKAEDGKVQTPSPGAYVSWFALGGREFYFAFDRANQSDPTYSRLYFDANGNRDLRDDAYTEPKEERVSDKHAWLRFPPIDVEYQLEGQTLPYAVSICLLKYLQEAPRGAEPFYQVLSTGIWAGTFAVNGTEYKISLSDGSFDGNYGTKITRNDQTPDRMHFEGDRFCVNRTGSSIGPYDSMLLSEHLVVQDNSYRLEVRTAERKAVLAPLATPAAAVKIEPGIRLIQLVSLEWANGAPVPPDAQGPAVPVTTALCLFDPSGIVHIPAGTYYVASYLNSHTDAQGDQWVLYAYGDLETATLTAVDAPGRPDAAQELPVGPPYRAIVSNIENQFKKGPADAWNLVMSVQGRGKEKVAAVLRVEGNSTQFKLSEKRPNAPIEPAWKVVTEDGETVANGVFEYG